MPAGLLRRQSLVAALLVAASLASAHPARAGLSLSKDAAELKLTEGLFVSGVSEWGRRAVNPDAVALALAAGTIGSPKEGDELKRPEALSVGTRAWKAIQAEGDTFDHLARGSYILMTVQADAERVMMLDARGHSMVYINGEPHAGDPYSNGKLHIPVRLKQGDNQLVFAHAGRGPMQAKLTAPAADVFLLTDDPTLPDVLSDKPQEYVIGVPVVNATSEPHTVIVGGGQDGVAKTGGETIVLPPLSVQKVPVHASLASYPDQKDVKVVVTITPKDNAKATANTTITLKAKSPDEVHCRTFVSSIDNSAQYVALTPPLKDGAVEHPALVMSLHGADVEAWKQAPCYSQKPDFVVVCPTNRRPYGFDWEDWGRADAIEAMDHARAWFHTDPRKQYLTGHSMGGHGTWQLGVLLPDRFAAIAPSAGWLSFDTYANVRGEPTESVETQIRAVLRRASASSDTLTLMPNLKGLGIYILHGDADDNVPVTEARHAKQELAKLNIPFEYHEQPGAGHWWDGDGPGTACVDWPPIFDMFRARSLPRPGDASEFHTLALEPGVALPADGGVRIVRAIHPGKPSRADVRVDRDAGHTSVTTQNVAAFALGEQALCAGPVCTIDVDGKSVKASPHDGRVVLVHRGGVWADWAEVPGHSASSAATLPQTGPFKNAFTNHFVMVYGTHGSADENAASLARARFDAEQWWYRGNGRAVLVTDDAFLKDLDGNRVQGNAILYGNSDVNAAAARLTANAAVRVDRHAAHVAGRDIAGDDVGVMAIGPFESSRGPALYALIAGTGLAGQHATDRVPYLLSGVGIPDVWVIRPTLWSKGVSGVECAGYLGPDFDANGADLVWKDDEHATAPSPPAPADPK